MLIVVYLFSFFTVCFLFLLPCLVVGDAVAPIIPIVPMGSSSRNFGHVRLWCRVRRQGKKEIVHETMPTPTQPPYRVHAEEAPAIAAAIHPSIAADVNGAALAVACAVVRQRRH